MSAHLGCGESNLDQSKKADALSDLVAKRLKHPFPLCVICGKRVLELPVHEFRFVELGTFESRTLRQRNHKVETSTHYVLCCLRAFSF